MRGINAGGVRGVIVGGGAGREEACAAALTRAIVRQAPPARGAGRRARPIVRAAAGRLLRFLEQRPRAVTLP